MSVIHEILNWNVTNLNPEYPAALGVAAGLGYTALSALCVTTYLHRSGHGSVEYNKPTEETLKTLTYATNGMSRPEWKVVHAILHHTFTGRYDQEAHEKWNAKRLPGMPEAPKHAFRGPYEPDLEGYKMVLFGTPILHRRAKKANFAFIRALHEYDVKNDLVNTDRVHWPEHFRNIKMDEINSKDIRDKYALSGPLGVLAVATPLLGAEVTLPATGTFLGILAVMGGIINSIAHTGQKKGFRNRAKVVLEMEEPERDENNNTAANMLEGNEGLLMGEFRHKDHHDKPQNPFLAGIRFRRDPGGWLIWQFVKRGWATVPAGIPKDLDLAA